MTKATGESILRHLAINFIKSSPVSARLNWRALFILRILTYCLISMAGRRGTEQTFSPSGPAPSKSNLWAFVAPLAPITLTTLSLMCYRHRQKSFNNSTPKKQFTCPTLTFSTITLRLADRHSSHGAFALRDRSTTCLRINSSSQTSTRCTN